MRESTGQSTVHDLPRHATLPPAVVLGIDTPIGLTVVRELGERGVPVHGIGRTPHAIGRASRYLSGFSVRPGREPLGAWLPALIEQTKAKALLAISENDLISLAELDPVLNGCRVLTPRTAQLKKVLDKLETLALASSLGIDTPQSWQPRIEDDFASKMHSLCFPVVAKWANPVSVSDLLETAGFPFIKADHASEPSALLALLDRYAGLDHFPLVQSYCPGVGFGQMLHMADGRATLRFQHERIHEWPPEGGVSSYCRAVPLDRHAEQMEESESLLRALAWEGPAMVEYRWDRSTGRYWLMEVNGRFWGSQPLARQCGAHFAWELYRRAILEEDSPAPPPRSKGRARFMVPETKRLARVLFRRSTVAGAVPPLEPWRDLGRYVAGFFDPKMGYYVFSVNDLGPFLADLRNMIREVFSRKKSITPFPPVGKLPANRLARRSLSMRNAIPRRFGTWRGAIRLGLSFGEIACRKGGIAACDLAKVRRLVFVCQGNVCRSAFAEAVARREGLATISFGLSTDGGQPANAAAREAAAKLGHNLDSHRTLTVEDYVFQEGDLLLAMETRQLRRIATNPRLAHLPRSLLGLWAEPPVPHIHDPFGLKDDYFLTCFRRIESAVCQLAHHCNDTLFQAERATESELPTDVGLDFHQRGS